MGTRSEDVITMGRRVIAAAEVPNVGPENDYTREIVEGLLETAGWLLTTIADGRPVQREDFLQRITVNAQGEQFIIDAIMRVVDSDDDLEKMQEFRTQQLRDLEEHQKTVEVDQIITKARRELAFNRSKVNLSDFVRNIYLALEPYNRVGSGSINDLGVMERVNVDDIDNIADQYGEKEGQEESNFAFRFGWQGVNRMFGEDLGLKRSKMVVVSALSHNFKSGLSLNMFRQAAMYNIPEVPKPGSPKEGKRPMLLHISYEQSVEENYKSVYAQIKLTETGERIDPSTITKSIREVAGYVKEHLSRKGWAVEFVRIDPDNSNFRQLFALLDHYENLGYEIQLGVIDYLGKLNREGCTQGPAGSDIKNMYSRTRFAFNKRNIALITCHQMSTKANDLAKMGSGEQLVHEVSGKGYYEGCSNLQTEVDIEIYCHIVDGYLTMRRGKHRGLLSMTPTKDLSCVYRFADNLAPGFADDVLGVDRSLRKVGEDQSGDANFLDAF